VCIVFKRGGFFLVEIRSDIAIGVFYMLEGIRPSAISEHGIL
jgi:hypothetical protein